MRAEILRAHGPSEQVIAQGLFRLRAFAKDLELGFAEIVDAAARIAVRQMQAHVGCDRLRIVMRDFTHIGGLQILSVLTYELERGFGARKHEFIDERLALADSHRSDRQYPDCKVEPLFG